MESEYESDPFVVVSFPEEEDSLAIIHKSWLKEDHRSTFWPIERNPGKRRKLTMQGAKPTGSWIEVQCIVKRWANTYEKAQDKLNSLQYSSDTNSERELGRGKRKRQRAMRFGDDEDNSSTDYGDSDEYVQPRAPTPPQPLSTGMSQHQQSRLTSFHTVQISVTVHRLSRRLLNQVHRPTIIYAFREKAVYGSTSAWPPPPHAEVASFTELQPLAFMERILQILNGIKQTQQAHSQYLNELLSNADSAPSHPCHLPELPFSDVADVLDYEKKLQTDKQAQHQMKKHMAVQGGDSTKQKTTRILQSLLSWNAAISFSWFGAKGKKKFSELHLCKLMCGTLTNDARHPDATLKDVERAAMTWFRHAAERLAAQQT
ncbi:hypothetical protein HPB49_018710 [Dermacentor silvarum]|uniref:Uncharacterized protein n=1 Tax=Dermacentor silvarum TaxID=543639 RepID=A0ACB8D7I0_DERSI|nr:hypothetical protein HPB49_018710 [Dermacentor silvarum]